MLCFGELNQNLLLLNLNFRFDLAFSFSRPSRSLSALRVRQSVPVFSI